MSTYARPEARTDEVDQLISSVARYDPQNASILEDYLSEQVRNDTWDLMANLALLKLIQFNPELVQAGDDESESPDTTQLVLVKAIAHAPFSADFSLCIALLGDRMSTLLSSEDQIKAFETATQLSILLRERDFVKFWATLNSAEVQQGPLYPAIQSLPSFSNLVRKSIAASIANTFRSLQKQRAQQWLGFTGEQAGDVETFAKETMGWSIEGDSVKIPSNEANDPKSTVQSETVDLSRLVRTLAQSVQV